MNCEESHRQVCRKKLLGERKRISEVRHIGKVCGKLMRMSQAVMTLAE